MGIYDRGYYADDQWKHPEDRRGATGPRSVVTTIIIINVVVFLLDMFSGPVTFSDGKEYDDLRLSYWMALKYGAAAVGASGPLDNPLCVYQFLTSGFAHASMTSERGIFHILMNMLVLFFLGRPMERKMGSREFLRFYLIAILVSGLIWLVVHALTGRPGMMVGASGGVVAVVMLFVFHFPREKLLLMGIVPMPAWLLGVLVVAGDVMSSFRPSGVAVEAHLGGALFAATYFYGRWNFGWLNTEGLSRRLARRPNLKVHHPEADESESGLSGEADRVLAKLHREGEASLTRRERRILEKYSREVRGRRD